METIEQWATILSPIIAVAIAAWMVHKSSKDTRKQMQALKNLSIMQISNTLDMLEMELYKFSLGKEEDKSELKTLQHEMNQLRREWKPDSKEMTRLQNKIEKLSKNVQYKDNFVLKITMRQFELMKGLNNVKNQEVVWSGRS